jgi:hypothetical protein
MFRLLFDANHRVLLTRFFGTLSREDLSAAAESARALMKREGPVRGLIDFSDVQTIDVSIEHFVSRARKPAVLADGERVYVMPRPDLYGLGRMYGTYQGLAGNREPSVVRTLAEAYVSLGLTEPDFRPVPESTLDRLA